MKGQLNNFLLNGHSGDSSIDLRVRTILKQHNEQYHMKVKLNSFQLTGHTSEFHSQTTRNDCTIAFFSMVRTH